MKRREFIFALGCGAAWPLAAHAQRIGRVRRIGFLMGYVEGDPLSRAIVSAFHEGLKSAGLQIGRDLLIDYRWPAGDPEKARSFARELIALQPDLIVASTNQVVSTLAAETRTIPIIFASVADPLGSRYAASFSRPGSNLTGFSAFEDSIGGKWLELIKEVSPQTQRVGLVYHPAASPHLEFLKVRQAAAPSLGLLFTPIPVTSPREIGERIDAFARVGSQGAIVVPPHALLEAQRGLIISLAARYRMASVIGNRSFPDHGGLLSFGAKVPDLFRCAATYVDAILKGANPAELPVQLPTKYELVVNLKTAITIGITMPPALLARADEVIE